MSENKSSSAAPVEVHFARPWTHAGKEYAVGDKVKFPPAIAEKLKKRGAETPTKDAN